MAREKTQQKVFLRDPLGVKRRHWYYKLEKDVEVDNSNLQPNLIQLFSGIERGEKPISLEEMIKRFSARDDLQEVGQNNLDWLQLRENQHLILWEWHERGYHLLATGTVWSRLNGRELSVAGLWPYFTWSQFEAYFYETNPLYRIVCLDKQKIR